MRGLTFACLGLASISLVRIFDATTYRHYTTHKIRIVKRLQMSTGETSPRISSNHQTSRSDSAVRMQGIPSDLLGSYGLKPKASGLICGPRSPTDNRRQLAAARWDSNAYRDQPLRDGKSKSKDGLKSLIKNDLAARHIRGFDQLELLTENEVPSDIYDKFEQTQGSCHTQFPLLDIKGKRGCTQGANGFTVPYESHIGAILGSQFRTSAFIRSEACYDVYALEDLFQRQDCFAKAYTLRGTKGKERDARLKNLKRGSNNTSRMASIDQNGRKWLVFSGNTESSRGKYISLDPLAWRGNEDYQTHFPGIDRRCRAYQVQCHTLTYASCFQTSKDSLQARPTAKLQRARDRQRHKRQERRANKVTARDAVEVKEYLLEGTGDSVEKSAEPVKSCNKIPSQEVDCRPASIEPAPSRSNLERAFSEEAEQSNTQDLRPPTPPNQAKLKPRQALYADENARIYIPCTRLQNKCLPCGLHIRSEDSRLPDGSRSHVTSFSGLLWYQEWAKHRHLPSYQFATFPY